MTIRQLISSIFTVTALVFATVASAQTPTASQEKQIKDAEERFASTDKNADGKLTLEEAKAGMPRIASNFKKIDTNNDGFVTIEEIKVMILK
ncbi:EF-hand domain-containing protein [Zwartia sp.]|uniref:EF-hand domain-containing protein n=1 Tax=Zwartia sp. TaxID=2978004 RepID=UPI003BB17ADE